MNRIFPGNADGAVPEYIASHIIEDMKGADFVIDIHASNIFLQEIPQARISEITEDDTVLIIGAGLTGICTLLCVMLKHLSERAPTPPAAI